MRLVARQASSLMDVALAKLEPRLATKRCLAGVLVAIAERHLTIGRCGGLGTSALGRCKCVYVCMCAVVVSLWAYGACV